MSSLCPLHSLREMSRLVHHLPFLPLLRQDISSVTINGHTPEWKLWNYTDQVVPSPYDKVDEESFKVWNRANVNAVGSGQLKLLWKVCILRSDFLAHMLSYCRTSIWI